MLSQLSSRDAAMDGHVLPIGRIVAAVRGVLGVKAE